MLIMHGTLHNMESHELLKDMLKRTSAKQVAAELGLSLSLIYKWAEPPVEGSGANNPLDRIDQLLKITADKRIAQWVCERAGGFFIANPDGKQGHRELMPSTNMIIQEFADMLQVIAVAAADQKITQEEARDIRSRWEDLKSATEGFVQAAEQGRFTTIESKLRDGVKHEERK